jgi:hypothetical protein
MGRFLKLPNGELAKLAGLATPGRIKKKISRPAHAVV